MDLKEKDIKLLIELFKNSKQSNRELAKICSYSKETVASKIEMFEKESYIKSFSLRVNYELLGFEEFNLFLRLKNMDSKKFEEFIQYLKEHKNITWIGESFGKYDLKVSIITKNTRDMNNIINQISNKYSQFIDLIDYLIIIDKFKASTNLFLQNLFEKDIKLDLKHKTKEIKKIELDKIEKNIIYLLGQNPKTSLVEIGNKLNLTAEAIKHRIKKLEKNNIIEGNSVVFNGEKFNKIWCLVLLSINLDKIEEFKNHLKKEEYLSNYSQTHGIWNFNVTLFSKDIYGLHQNLNSLRNKFSQSIRNFEFLIFFDIYKYPQIPKCILD